MYSGDVGDVVGKRSRTCHRVGGGAWGNCYYDHRILLILSHNFVKKSPPPLPHTALHSVSVKSEAFWDALLTGNLEQSARGNIADGYTTIPL